MEVSLMNTGFRWSSQWLSAHINTWNVNECKYIIRHLLWLLQLDVHPAMHTLLRWLQQGQHYDQRLNEPSYLSKIRYRYDHIFSNINATTYKQWKKSIIFCTKSRLKVKCFFCFKRFNELVSSTDKWWSCNKPNWCYKCPISYHHEQVWPNPTL